MQNRDGCAGLAMLAALMLGGAGLAHAQVAGATVQPMPGWQVLRTVHSFAELVRRLETAIKANGMGIVTAASASEGAKAQGIVIPGNRVVGVFRNDFARRMLTASLSAGIEAPIRFYLTENADGTSSLSYKTPSAVFAPYQREASADLAKVAGELDAIFAKIASDASKAGP